MRLIDDLTKLESRRYIASFDMAIAWLGLGDKERALAALQRAIQARSPRLLFLIIEPRFDPLRSGPRFKALVNSTIDDRDALTYSLGVQTIHRFGEEVGRSKFPDFHPAIARHRMLAASKA